MLVINAQITNTPGMQTIQISRSDGLLYPEFIPESNCVVEVESEEGSVVSFTEANPGYYQADVSASFMRFGRRYMLRVITVQRECVYQRLCGTSSAYRDQQGVL